eukprot:jgi/Botrbrau1/16065/Bobra.7_2s0036.1
MRALQSPNLLSRLLKINRVYKAFRSELAPRSHPRRQIMATAGVAQTATKPLNHHFTGLPTTVFTVMTNLAIEHNSVNLGQGFPDEEGPDKMLEIAGEALIHHHNQYPPMMGLPETRQAVAEHSLRYCGLPLDWASETLITVGATEALAAAFLGLLNPGDEVVLFDPMYDSYVPICTVAGADVRVVRLPDGEWAVPHEQLAAAFNSKTKLIVVNTPHNPTGKVFTKPDLEYIADLCRQYNVYAILDEVYEHLVFDGSQHVSLRSLPGMAERCLRIGSAGKTFSFTGWKIGWLTGPKPLVAAAAKAHQFLTFTVASSLQRSVAYGLQNERSFFEGLGRQLQKKREFLADRLSRIGFRVLPAQGTYFLVADFRPLLPAGSRETDVEFCKRLTVEAGVTVIPVSAFYTGEDPPVHMVRFCFCKEDQKLAKAASLLEAYFATQKSSNNGPTTPS